MSLKLNRLEKQAVRAGEIRPGIMTHLEDLLRVWYGYRWGQGQVSLREARARLRESEAAVKAQRNRLTTLEKEVGELRTRHTELRASLGSWYAENNQLLTQAEAIQRKLAVNEERARQFASQREETVAEMQSLAAGLAGQKRLVAEAQEKLQTINQELHQAGATLQAVQRRLDAHQSQRQSILARQAVAEKRVRQLATALTERQTRLAQLDERRESLLAERASCENEIARLAKEGEEVKARQAQLTAELRAVEQNLSTLERQQTEQQKILAQFHEATEQLKTQRVDLYRREDSLKARQDVLGNLRSELAGYFEGVRAVLQSEARLAGIIGTVSQVLRVPPDLEVAIEAALGSRLQDVIIDTFANAEAAIAELKKGQRGRATFLPLDSIRPGPAVTVPDTAGVVGLASELVEVEDRLRPIVELTLNRTILVDDLPAAHRAFVAMQGGFQIVTREGELVRSSGAVTGGRAAGKQGQAGTLLAREREWRELPQQIARITQALQSLSSQLEHNQKQATVVERKIQALADERRQQEAQRQKIQAVADQVSRSVEQLTGSIGWQQELQTRAETGLKQLEQRKIEIQHELAQLEQEQREAEETARQLAREVNALSAENLLAELSQAKSTVALIQGRQKSQQTILENHQNAAQQLLAQISSKRSKTESLAAGREALLQHQQELQAQSQEFNRGLEEFAAQIRDTENRLAELETRQQQLEQIESSLRHQLHRLEAEHSRISLETARRQDELDNLQRQIEDDLGLVNLEISDDQVGQPVLPMRPLVSDLPVVEELPPGVAEDVKRLKVQARRLGNINPDAPREYAELRERYDFLTHQMADLEAAAADLKEVIAKLDTTMEEAFTNTFGQVAKEFQRYFKTLFGGGEAQLLLADPDNLIDTGVDVVARPPGKRLQSLALLSGGERALTAQALIFALLTCSPTPFVIFDEVDAMLDEANVGRFRDALVDLARDIQFIVITHNRKTIEAAKTLYGISMGEDSVSQVYSLKVDEWLEKAA